MLTPVSRIQFTALIAVPWVQSVAHAFISGLALEISEQHRGIQN
jgi:hypothetical protein